MAECDDDLVIAPWNELSKGLQLVVYLAPSSLQYIQMYINKYDMLRS